MWAGSTKDHSFAENRKSNARRIYRFEKDYQIIFPVQIDIPVGPSTSVIAKESKARLKRGRPLGSKDQNPRKKIKSRNDTTKNPHFESQDASNSCILGGINDLDTQENYELSIKSSNDEINLNCPKIAVDYVFAYNVA